MFEIEIHDIKWNCTKFGKSENPCIIFLHGFMGTSEDWIPLMKRLAGEYYCIAFDLPGHNLTEVEGYDEFYTIENTCTSLKKEIENQGIKDFHLVAYSMGGRIALTFAIKYPEIINKLVLISTSPGIESAELREERIKFDADVADKIRTSELHNFLKLWYSAPIFAGINQTNLFGKLISRRAYNNKESLVKSLIYTGTGKMRPLWNDIQTFPKPVLLIAGERDRKYCIINSKMDELFTNSTFKIIKNSAHIVFIEQPKEFEIELRNFIK